MLIAARTLARLRDRSGFTLIETLVAMVTGVIVTGALFAILEVSARQSSHLSNSAQATTVGRATMNRLTSALHSGCIIQGFAPVKAKSTGTLLYLVNGYDQKPSEETPAKEAKASATKEPPAELTENDIYLDVVEYKESAKTLTDTRYTAEGTTQTNGEYKWKKTPYSTYVLANVVPSEEGGEKFVFRYYGYRETPNTETNAAASTLNESEPLVKTGQTLTAAGAKKVAAVKVQLYVEPGGRTEYKQATSVQKGVGAEFSTLATFAFMSPDSEASITAGPCE